MNLGQHGSTVFITLSAHKYKARFILKMLQFDLHLIKLKYVDGMEIVQLYSNFEVFSRLHNFERILSKMSYL